MGRVDVVHRKDLMRLRPQWASIAQDVVLTRVPKEDGSGMLMTAAEICEVYQMTVDECKTLLRLPEFKRLVHDFKKRVDAMGDNASITLRAQMLAADMMEDVYVSAKGCGDTKDKLAAFKALAQIGGLDPATNGTNRPSKDSGGSGLASLATVIINVPAGIPGMDHIYNAKQVIDGEVARGD
jgi:hypothetical protein